MTKLAELQKLVEAKLVPQNIGVIKADLTDIDGVPVLKVEFGMGTHISVAEYHHSMHKRFDDRGARAGVNTFVFTQVAPKMKKSATRFVDLSDLPDHPVAIDMIVELAGTMPIHLGAGR